MRYSLLFVILFWHSFPLAPSKPMDIHGLRPGMITREIVLYAHAPLDTIEWGGSTGPSIIGFRGTYLDDSGSFRVNVVGTDIVRVTFNSNSRSLKANADAFARLRRATEKALGNPLQDYHNFYRIVTWNADPNQFTLTTTDSGRFYSAALVPKRN